MNNTVKLDKAPKYRFIAFALMVLPYLLTYGGIQITSSLGNDIMNTFGFAEGALSLFSSLGTLTKAIISMIAGGLMVKFGGKKVVMAGLAVSAFSGLLYLLVPTNFLLLCLVRVIQGVGGGMTAACLMALVCVWFPKKERGTAQSALTCFFGLSVSAVTFYIYLCQRADIVWDKMIGIWLLGGGGVMFLLIALFYKDIEKKFGVASIDDALIPQENEKKPSRGVRHQDFKRPDSWAKVIRFPGFWLAFIMTFFSGACLYGVGFVMPLFLREIGFDAAGSTSVMSLGPLSSIIFALLGGAISDRVFGSRSEVTMISYFGCAVLFGIICLSGGALSVPMMTALFFLAYGAMYFSSGPLWCIPAEVVRQQDASKNMGVCVMASGIGGFVMMLAFGILIQNTSASMGLWFLAICMLIVALCAVLLKRTYHL